MFIPATAREVLTVRGLCITFIKNFGIEVPRISAAYSGFGQPVSLEDCQKGDIILFTGTNYSRSSVGHVGIIISDRGEPVRFIPLPLREKSGRYHNRLSQLKISPQIYGNQKAVKRFFEFYYFGN